MTVEVEELFAQARDAMTVKKVFGDPIEHDGITLIPVAKVRGGAGGGSGEAPDEKGKGWGGGYGVSAKAMGTYVIKGDTVRFVPAVDVNRTILVSGLVTMTFLWTIGKPFAKALAKRLRGKA